MKILTVCERLFPDTSGGPSFSIYVHNKYLTLNNIQSTTITTAFGIPSNLTDKWMDTEIGRLIYLKQKIHKLPIRLLRYSFKEIKHHDIIHIHSFFYTSSIIIAIYAFFYKKRIVWTIHGELDDACLNSKRIKKMLFLNTFKKIVKKIALFHVTSTMEETYVFKNLGKATHTIKIPTLLEFTSNEEKCETEKYFLYVGRFHEKKGIDILINAAKESELFLKSDFTIKLVGDYNTPYGEKISSHVEATNLSNKIHLIGKVTEETKRDLYRRAYFTIMPSITENFGLVAAESLSLGTPVITTNGTPWELIKERCGFYVECDKYSISKAIDSAIIMDKNDYQKFRLNSKKLINDHYNIENKFHNWTSQYESLLS